MMFSWLLARKKSKKEKPPKYTEPEQEKGKPLSAFKKVTLEKREVVLVPIEEEKHSA